MIFLSLLVFLFLIIIRPQDFVPLMAGLPLVSLVMLVLAAVYFFSSVPKKFLKTPADRFVTLFFVMMVVSTVSVHWLSYTLETIVETLKVAMAYYLVVNLVNDEKKARQMTCAIVGFLTIIAGMGILQYYGYDITGMGMLWSSDKGIWQIRGAGIFHNPNDLAYSVVPVVPFALGFFFHYRSFMIKAVSTIVLAVAVYCTFLTGSRGGLLCLIVAGLCWSYFWANSRLMKRMIAVTAIIAILVSVGMVAGDYRRDESSMERIEAWAAGMDMLKSHPLIGVGKGQFGEYHYRDSHSSFMRCAAETGMVGLYAWLGMIYCSMVSLLALRRMRGSRRWKPYIVGYAVFMPVYLFASIFSSRTYDTIFFLAVAMISAFQRFLPLTAAEHEDSVRSFFARSRRIRFFEKNIAILTVGVLVVLKLFLIQVW